MRKNARGSASQAALPVNVLQIAQVKIEFVDKGCRLKGMSVAFLQHVPPR
jgi:hypothetical protein